MHPVPVSERISVIYADRGVLEREGHSLVLRQGDVDTVLPVGITAAIMIGPGVSVTHAAVALCAQERTLILWVGEQGVRLYAAGEPRGHPERLIVQAGLHADPSKRLNVARQIFSLMFGEDPPPRRSIEQLRGIEGAKVRALYTDIGAAQGIPWRGRAEGLADPVNAALAGVNAALYGLTEAVILSLGYSPSIGFVHSGDPRSFVFDVADTVKFRTVVPLAFRLVADRAAVGNMEHRSRVAARDLFVREGMAGQLVTIVERLLDGHCAPGS